MPVLTYLWSQQRNLEALLLKRRPRNAWQRLALGPATTTAVITAAVAALALPGVVLPAALALLAGVCRWMLPTETLIATTVISASVVGSYVTVRLGTSPERVAAFLLLAAGSGLAVNLVLTRSAERLLAVTERQASVLIGAAILLRAAPAPLGYAKFQSGRLEFVQIGEFTRPVVVVVFAAWAVTGIHSRIGSGRPLRTLITQTPALLALAYVAELVVAQDLGPAVLTCAGLATALPWRIRSRRQRAAVLTGLTLVALSLAATVPVIRGRLLSALNPAANSQLREALGATSWGGFVGDGSNPFASFVSAAASDMLPAMTIGLLGAIPYAALLIALLTSSARLLRRADRAEDGARAVSLALTAMLATMIVWTATANIALGPLTGVSQPFSTMTGSSIVPSVIVLAAVAALTSAPARRRPATGSRVVRRVAGFLAVPVSVVVVVGTLLCAVLPARTPDIDLAFFPRGQILTADGHVVAPASDGGGARSLVSPDYAEVGTVSGTPASGISAFGVEAMQVRSLTCGGAAPRTATIESINRPARCRPAAVVLTMSSAVQHAAARALAGQQGEIAILDTDTGGVIAEYATADTAPAVPVPDGGIESAARNGGIAPGAVMKIVTATASLVTGTDASSAPRAFLEFPDNTRLENENGFVCPEGSIEAMLAFACNTVPGYLAGKVGAHAFQQVASRYFGFDRPALYDGVPDAYDGGRFLTATTGLAALSTIDAATLARTAIGLQGVRANALALAQIGEVVARPGRLSPATHIVAGICDGGSFHPTPVTGTVAPEALPADIARTVRHGMRLSVEQGSARRLHSLGPDVAAKTGAADVTHKDGTVTTDATLIALFGHYAIAVIIHLPDQGSSSAAVDLAAAVIPWLDQAPRSVTCP